MTAGSNIREDLSTAIADAVFEQVKRAVPEGLECKPTLDSRLDEIGLDSLARMSVVNYLEERFQLRFSEDALYDMETCRDLIEYLEGHVGPAGVGQRAEAPAENRLREPEAPRSREILPQDCDVTLFPECVAFQHRITDTMAAGFANPFFRVKQRVDKTTCTIDGREVVSYTVFDYLGMARQEAVIAAAKEALDRFGASAAASRLVGGNNTLLEQLDEEIAQFVGTEAATVFPSGHGTNTSVLGHLFGSEDLILYDELAHNSIAQGALLSHAKIRAFPHNDCDFLERLLADVRHNYRRVVIALDGVYSMDGDYPDLPRFIEIKRRHGAVLYVDEAHSLGTMGAHGRGICEHFGVDPGDGDIWMGTISKALGSLGGFIAGREVLVQYLKYNTPSFVFATALSPANTAAALAALKLLRDEPQCVERLRNRSRLFLELAQQAGLNTGDSRDTPIIPVILGNSLKCLKVSTALLAQGIDAQSILYPAVPDSKSRIRFFINAEHTEEQIRRTVRVLLECVNSF